MNLFSGKRFKLTAALLFLILALLPVDIIAASPINWAIHGSIFYFAADNGTDADPPAIIPSAGFSLAMQIMPFLRIEFTEDIYFTNYEYNSALGYPMACNPENRSAFVMGFVTGVQAVGVFSFGNYAVRVYGGPAADIRIVTLAFGLNHPADYTGIIETDAQLQTDAISSYFWSSGRWFMPAAGVGFDFPLNEKYLLGFDLRTWFPIYRLWTNEEIPFIDGWRFGVGFRITAR